jgi:hypothetical protein
MNNEPAYLLKRDGSLVVYLNGIVKTFGKESKLLARALEAIKAKDWDGLLALLHMRDAIVRLTNGRVTIVDNDVYYDGAPIHNALSRRIIEFFNEGRFDAAPLINFLNNLMLNPSEKSRDQLYGFLDACDLPITEDGCFLAYKMVREDYYDQHSGKFRNTVGAEISMPRDEVDADENVTCSTGLHVASLGYISRDQYGSGCGARLMVCKVNPRDVVSVPVDYNNSKMRTCRYLVINEITDPAMMPKNISCEKVQSDARYHDFYNENPDDVAEDSDVLIDVTDRTYRNGDLKEVLRVYKPAAKGLLSDAKVAEVWNLIKTGVLSDTEIQRRTGVNRRTVYRIRVSGSYNGVPLTFV